MIESKRAPLTGQTRGDFRGQKTTASVFCLITGSVTTREDLNERVRMPEDQSIAARTTTELNEARHAVNKMCSELPRGRPHPQLGRNRLPMPRRWRDGSQIIAIGAGKLHSTTDPKKPLTVAK